MKLLTKEKKNGSGFSVLSAIRSTLYAKKGFTLIELLIVVVILGILAALVIPRMAAQPEQVVKGEALQYLGVIRRAQDLAAQPTTNYVDASSSTTYAGYATSDAGWKGLGLGDLPASTSFIYKCVGGAQTLLPAGSACAVVAGASGTGAGVVEAGACTATRITGTTKLNGAIGVSIATGYVCGCASPYSLSGGSGANTAGATCA